MCLVRYWASIWYKFRGKDTISHTKEPYKINPYCWHTYEWRRLYVWHTLWVPTLDPPRPTWDVSGSCGGQLPWAVSGLYPQASSLHFSVSSHACTRTHTAKSWIHLSKAQEGKTYIKKIPSKEMDLSTGKNKILIIRGQ